LLTKTVPTFINKENPVEEDSIPAQSKYQNDAWVQVQKDKPVLTVSDGMKPS
jgi:hypothetical protein